MGYGALLFSLLFFTAAIIYLFFGIYLINSNPKASLHRTFLAVSLASSLGAFASSLANSSPDLQGALFWWRIAAAGWALVYSTLLPFLLLLAGKKCDLRHCLPLYLPTAITLVAFIFMPTLLTPEGLIKTNLGWVQVGQDVFFTLYYLGYLLIFAAILWRWSHKASAQAVKKQARLIFAALFIPPLLQILSIVILPSHLPQLQPLFTLLPMAAIYYSIRHYRLRPAVLVEESELLLDTKTRARLYHYLAITFLGGGFLSFLSYFFPQANGGSTILRFVTQSGLLFLGVGFTVFLFNLLKNEELKNMLITAAILFSIPLFTFQFREQAAVTMWAFPLILILLSLVFNTRTQLVLITVTTISCQAISWAYGPQILVPIHDFDYILRIVLFITAFWVGIIVNNLYRQRVRENLQQINFQKMISKISFDFMSVKKAHLDQKIEAMLQEIGRFFGVDRTYVILVDHRQKTMHYSHEWREGGIEPKVGVGHIIPVARYPWLMEMLFANKLVYARDLQELPKEAAAERKQQRRENVKSWMAIPIKHNAEGMGFLGFDSVAAYREWSTYHTEQLKILANLLADVLIRAEAEEEIEYMAYYDQLTALPNRALFTDRLNLALQLAKRTATFVGVMFINLDGFKAINDIIGHSGGDAILREVGQALGRHFRQTDTVARFGGDEFMIMFPNLTHAQSAVTIAEKVMQLFQSPFVRNGQDFFITGSAGVALYPTDGEEAETLIKNANIAMFNAKSAGKNQYVFCSPHMKAEVKKNMTLSNDLFRAQERGELHLYYQPQVNLATGQIVGVEALVRWDHPQMGILQPDLFIPLAEKNGSISDIGEWVLKTACGQNKAWQQQGLAPVRMAVNLSIIQFNDPRIVQKIQRALEQTGLAPHYLELEITESIAIKEPIYAIGVLERLKKLGVSISIDDFGTEYSSLSRLKALPVDRLKIDMQFIQGIESNEKDRAITEIIINLGKSLGLQVIAEGVQTKAELDFLRQKQCDDVQGFYYHQPLPPQTVGGLLRPQEKQPG